MTLVFKPDVAPVYWWKVMHVTPTLIPLGNFLLYEILFILSLQESCCHSLSTCYSTAHVFITQKINIAQFLTSYAVFLLLVKVSQLIFNNANIGKSSPIIFLLFFLIFNV